MSQRKARILGTALIVFGLVVGGSATLLAATANQMCGGSSWEQSTWSPFGRASKLL